MIEAVLELESRIFNGIVRSRDEEIEEIAKEYNVKDKDLEPYFDLLENYRIKTLNLKRTLQKRIVWNLEERMIIDYYIKNTEYSKTEKFKHLSRILSNTERTKESISFDYYNNIAPKDKQKKLRVLFKTMGKSKESEDLLLKTEKDDIDDVSNSISDVTVKEENSINLVDTKLEKSDFLSNMSDFINNGKKLRNFNLEEFFQGITLLTSLAANNVLEVEEIDELKLKIKEQEKIIESLNVEIDSLNDNIKMIYKEILEFDKLDGIDKIGEIKEFIDKLIELTKY